MRLPTCVPSFSTPHFLPIAHKFPKISTQLLLLFADTHIELVSNRYLTVDIINNPTIGSGQIAPPVAGLVSHEDYDALNKEADNPVRSKRVESSLEYVQSLLKPEKITFL